ncbi:MAG: HK97 family phage prohead protease [bacterium]|jgi:hypothetical protein
MPTFVASDDSINSYGFRVLTEGIDTSDFDRNPVMLYGHLRFTSAQPANANPMLPIGKWVNIRKQGDKLLVDAEFDDGDAFAMDVSRKVEKGILSATSIGFDIIELSEDPAYMLVGQVLPTITKCKLKEISIADIPVNANALKLGYQGNYVTLSDGKGDVSQFFSNYKPKEPMKEIIARLSASGFVVLAASANEAEVAAAVETVINQHKEKSNELANLKMQLSAKDTKITELTNELTSVQTKATENLAVALVDSAIESKKITAAQKDQFLKLAKADYASTKAVLDSMAGYVPVSAQLSVTEEVDETAKLIEEYDKLFKAGKLAQVKVSNPEHFKKMHKAKYNVEPK